MDEIENIQELVIQMKELTESVAKKEEEVTVAEFQYREAEKALRKLYQDLQDRRSEVNHDRRVIREIAPKIERAERLQAAKEKRDRLLAEFKAKSAELDELTGNAKWRGFAFEHQVEGGKKLAVARRGILADKRGLGKTLTSLIWADMVQAKRIVVFAPNDICTQFEDEVKHWAPDRYIFALRGLNPAQRQLIYPILQGLDEFIVILNYEAWRKDKTVVDDLVRAGIDTIICDEAHKIKSWDKITARGVFQVAYRPNYCETCKKVENWEGPWEQKSDDSYARGKVLKDHNVTKRFYACSEGHQTTTTVQNVLCMTGTPILNKPQELFSLLYLVDPSRFPDEKKFLYDYCMVGYSGKWEFAPGGSKRLTSLMSEFFLQRTPQDAGITVPPPSIKVYYIEKDKVKYARQYQAEKDLKSAAALVLENGEVKNFFYILEIILRQRQCMTWPAGIILRDPDTKEIIANFDVEESQKIDEATILLEDLIEEEQRVVVFSKFKAPLYEMQKRFERKAKTVVATGDQNDYLRDQVKRDFDLKYNDGENFKWQVVFATYDAFGTGVNLNAARHLILLDDEWNPGMEDQAIGRIDRMNNEDQANVHIFRVKNSIDDWMEGIIEQKKKMLDGLQTELDAKKLIEQLRSE